MNTLKSMINGIYTQPYERSEIMACIHNNMVSPLRGKQGCNSPHPSTEQDSGAPSLGDSETVKVISDNRRSKMQNNLS
jgi:hypothetical protein